MNRSVLYSLHATLGARFFETSEGDQVSSYGSAETEHLAVRTTSGIIDLSHRGKLVLTGRDRVSFLHGMITNDVKKLRPGEGTYAAVVTAQGQTLADLRVYCREDHLLLEMEAGLAGKVAQTLHRYLISEDVTIEDVTDGLALLTVCGPDSPGIVGAVMGGAAASLAPLGSVGVDDALVARVDETGEVGFLVFVPTSRGGALWHDLMGEKGGVRPVGQEAFRILRMEAGIPVYGIDIEPGVTPIEASIPHAVSFDKGCYIGQEVIAKMAFRGRPRRHLVGFVFEGDRRASALDPVVRDGAEIGRVTSSLHSLSLRRGIAMGYVKRDENQPGSRVEFPADGETLRGEIVEMPFYRRGA